MQVLPKRSRWRESPEEGPPAQPGRMGIWGRVPGKGLFPGSKRQLQRREWRRRRRRECAVVRKGTARQEEAWHSGHGRPGGSGSKETNHQGVSLPTARCPLGCCIVRLEPDSSAPHGCCTLLPQGASKRGSPRHGTRGCHFAGTKQEVAGKHPACCQVRLGGGGKQEQFPARPPSKKVPKV